MFKEIGRGFCFGIGFILGGAVLKATVDELLKGMKKTEAEAEPETETETQEP